MAETDIVKQEKKKNRSQFSPDERVRLMKIMEEYATRLANKKLSTLVRKEIWLSIEKKFNNGNSQERNAAQLKKYWQNFKYHSKKTKLAQKAEDSTTEKVVIKEEKVFPDNWHEYCIDFDLDMLTNPKPSNRQSQQEFQLEPKLDDLTKFNTDSAVSKVNQSASVNLASSEGPLDLSTKTSGQGQAKNFGSEFREGTGQVVISLSDMKLGKKVENCLSDNRSSKLQRTLAAEENIRKYDVVVSNSKVTDNKVVVSLVCPEKVANPSSKKFSTIKISSPCFNPALKKFAIANSESEKCSRISSQAESFEMMKLRMFESLKRSAPEEFRNCTEKSSAKSARLTLVSRDKNKFQAITKIPENVCVIRRIKNVVNEKVVDKEMKLDSPSELGCYSVSIEKIDKDLEAEKVKIKDNTEVSSTLENRSRSGLSHFSDAENEDEIKVEDVLATSNLSDKEKSSDVFVKFEWDHRLLLRQLETKELLLKLEIVETAIQEIRLRILAMDEDINHKNELQDLVRKLVKNLSTGSDVSN